MGFLGSKVIIILGVGMGHGILIMGVGQHKKFSECFFWSMLLGLRNYFCQSE